MRRVSARPVIAATAALSFAAGCRVSRVVPSVESLYQRPSTIETVEVASEEVLMRRILTVLGVLTLLVVGCGDDDAVGTDAPTTSGPAAEPTTTTGGTPSTTMTTSTGAVAATSCEELADNFIASTQGMLDAYGDTSFAALHLESVPPEWEAAGALWLESSATMGEMAESLGCGDGLDQLICERQPQLDPQGDAGLKLISENTPCGVEGTLGSAAAAAYEARSEAWYESQE